MKREIIIFPIGHHFKTQIVHEVLSQFYALIKEGLHRKIKVKNEGMLQN